MSNLPPQTTPVYATDEDIAVRATGDFITLCPAWQQMAAGTDGYFSAAAGWVLNSTATDFGANGVAPNQVVVLSGPKSTFPGSGQLLAIDSVSGNAITLRRLHQDLNVGNPPGPAAGLTGVTFSINTMGPQIEEVSYDLKQRFGIDENITFRYSTWIYDLRVLRMATILTVLKQRYRAETRTERGDFALKANSIQPGARSGARSIADPLGAVRQQRRAFDRLFMQDLPVTTRGTHGPRIFATQTGQLDPAVLHRRRRVHGAGRRAPRRCAPSTAMRRTAPAARTRSSTRRSRPATRRPTGRSRRRPASRSPRRSAS